MKIIENELNLLVPINIAFNWFKDLDKNYLKWHPPTHLDFLWLSDKPIEKGSKFCFEEDINGHKHTMLMEVSEYVENSRLSFASVKILVKSKYFPDWFMSFISSLFKMQLEMNRIFKSVSENSTVIYTTHKFACNLPGINRMVEWFINSFIFSNKYHENHMREENDYMRNSLENHCNHISHYFYRQNNST